VSDTSKVWVVTEYSWEYNDEYNYTPEGDPGYPVVAFTTAEAADKACLTRNIAAMRASDNLLSYNSNDGWGAFAKGGEGCEINDVKAFCVSRGWECDDSTLVLPKSASDDDIEKLMAMSSLRFFSVREIGLDKPIPVTPPSVEEPPKPEPPKPEPPPEPPYKKNIIVGGD